MAAISKRFASGGSNVAPGGSAGSPRSPTPCATILEAASFRFFVPDMPTAFENRVIKAVRA